MKLLLFLLLLTIVGCTRESAHYKTDGDDRTLERIDFARIQAIVRGDTAVANRLYYMRQDILRDDFKGLERFRKIMAE